MDHPAIVHDVNVLTVVASESYKDFVRAAEGHQRLAVCTPEGGRRRLLHRQDRDHADRSGHVTDDQATDIEFYLIQNGYVDRKRNVTEKYHQDKKNGTLAALPRS
jgi:type III restriction enzyme